MSSISKGQIKLISDSNSDSDSPDLSTWAQPEQMSMIDSVNTEKCISLYFNRFVRNCT